MVVVFGDSGIIGRELSSRLRKSGYTVTGISTEQCDLLDPGAVRLCVSALPRPFDIVNCAVINRSNCSCLDGLRNNILLMHNILEAIPPGACRSFIQLSSVDVYGQKPVLPINEDTPVRPSTYYAMAKLDCEWLLEKSTSKDFKAAVLRLPGVYGPGDKGQSVIGKLLRQAFNREPISLNNGGELLRDYLFVDDLLRVIMTLLDTPRDLLLNVVTGQSRSLREILDVIFVSSVTGSVVSCPSCTGLAAADLVFDNSRYRQVFPDFIFTDVKDGIVLYANAFKENPGE